MTTNSGCSLIQRFGLGLGCLILTACGSGSGVEPTKTAVVSGTVSLDGKPLADGEIVFAIPDKVTDATLAVKNGKFSGNAPIGTNQVKIYAYKTSPSPVADSSTMPDADIKENIIPAKWNEQTSLSAEVKEGGAASLKFEITSQ